MTKQFRTLTKKEYDEFTDEGREMWEALNKERQEDSKINKTELVPLPPINLFRLEVYHLRLEIRKMIRNSEKVIEDCSVILSKINNAEEYQKTEIKTVKLIHLNLIKRLGHVLNGHKAFDKDIEIEDEPERPYEVNQLEIDSNKVLSGYYEKGI